MQHPDDGTKVTNGSRHPDEGAIHAWLDGELSQSESDVLRAHLNDCAECRVSVAEARGLVAASARILRSLDDGPGGVRANASSDTPAATGSASAGRQGSGVSAAGHAPSERVAGADGIRFIGDARTVRPADAKVATRAGRWWRLSAIAAVGLLAVGTTVVLQRNGPLAPFTAGSSAGQVASASADALAAADSQLLTTNPAVTGRTEPAPAEALSKSAEVARAQGASARDGNPAAEKSASSVDERPEAPPVAVAPRPPQSSAAVAAAAAGSNVGTDSAPKRPAPAFVSAPRSLARVARQDRTQAELAGERPPVLVQAPEIAVGPVLVGRVTSADGDPVAQAMVTVPGTSSAAVTDVTGHFRLTGIPAGEHTATIRRLGFEPARLSLLVGERGDSVVAVALIPVETSLQDVVVTGVGTVQRPPTAAAESARLAAEAGAKAPSIISRPTRPPPVTPSPLAASSDSAPADGTARAAIAQRLAACYRLEVGGAPGASRDSAEMALPGWIRLAPTAAPDRPGWLEATSLQPERRSREGSTGWRIVQDEEVEIVWPTSSYAREVILRLLGSGEVLTGTAALRSVGATTTDEREAASIVAVRGVCNY